MNEQVTCGDGCGACSFRTPFWEHGDSGYTALEFYCPRCGARLSFDENGGPVVEARQDTIARAVAKVVADWEGQDAKIRVALAQERADATAAIARSVAEERERIRTYIDRMRLDSCDLDDVMDREALWGPPEPAQEEASDAE